MAENESVGSVRPDAAHLKSMTMNKNPVPTDPTEAAQEWVDIFIERESLGRDAGLDARMPYSIRLMQIDTTYRCNSIFLDAKWRLESEAVTRLGWQQTVPEALDAWSDSW